jgi:hypothetical protein
LVTRIKNLELGRTGLIEMIRIDPVWAVLLFFLTAFIVKEWIALLG